MLVYRACRHGIPVTHVSANTVYTTAYTSTAMAGALEQQFLSALATIDFRPPSCHHVNFLGLFSEVWIGETAWTVAGSIPADSRLS